MYAKTAPTYVELTPKSVPKPVFIGVLYRNSRRNHHDTFCRDVWAP